MSPTPGDYTFSLCLSHDVDRVSKSYQSLYYAVTERNLSHLKSIFAEDDPYWQFEEIMELEDDLGVRSSFYFLNEKRLFRDKPVSEWARPRGWRLYAGRYDTMAPKVADVMRRLYDGGWEVGLHGSYDSYADRSQLASEKDRLETALGADVVGGRQHYLNLNRPETWRHHQRIGLNYDSSLGSTTDVGFGYGYDVVRPFDGEFVVFPLTAMEVALLRDRSVAEAWEECERLLDEAMANGAIMTVLWHQRYFNEAEFPGYRELYRRLVEAATERGAWVGPLAELYERLEPGAVAARA
jgi:hypothetical protein